MAWEKTTPDENYANWSDQDWHSYASHLAKQLVLANSKNEGVVINISGFAEFVYFRRFSVLEQALRQQGYAGTFGFVNTNGMIYLC